MNDMMEYWKQEWNAQRKEMEVMRQDFNHWSEKQNESNDNSDSDKNQNDTKYFGYTPNGIIKKLYRGKQLKELDFDLPGEAYLVKDRSVNRKYNTYITVPRNSTIKKIKIIAKKAKVTTIGFDTNGNELYPNEHGIVIFHDGTSSEIVEGTPDIIPASKWKVAIHNANKSTSDIAYLMHSHPKVYGDSSYDNVHKPSVGDRDIRNKFSDGIGLIVCEKEKRRASLGTKINQTTSSDPNDYESILKIYTPDTEIPEDMDVDEKARFADKSEDTEIMLKLFMHLSEQINNELNRPN